MHAHLTSVHPMIPSVYDSLRSHDLQEVEAAIACADKFCAHSPAIIEGLEIQLSDMLFALETPPDVRLKLIPLLRHHRASIEAMKRVEALCESLLSLYPTLDLTLVVTRTLSLLTYSTPLQPLTHVERLCRLIVDDPRLAIKQCALQDLRMLCRGSVWTLPTTLLALLWRVVNEAPQASLQAAALRVLQELVQVQNIFMGIDFTGFLTLVTHSDGEVAAAAAGVCSAACELFRTKEQWNNSVMDGREEKEFSKKKEGERGHGFESLYRPNSTHQQLMGSAVCTMLALHTRSSLHLGLMLDHAVRIGVRGDEELAAIIFAAILNIIQDCPSSLHRHIGGALRRLAVVWPRVVAHDDLLYLAETLPLPANSLLVSQLLIAYLTAACMPTFFQQWRRRDSNSQKDITNESEFSAIMKARGESSCEAYVSGVTNFDNKESDLNGDWKSTDEGERLHGNNREQEEQGPSKLPSSISSSFDLAFTQGSLSSFFNIVESPNFSLLLSPASQTRLEHAAHRLLMHGSRWHALLLSQRAAAVGAHALSAYICTGLATFAQSEISLAYITALQQLAEGEGDPHRADAHFNRAIESLSVARTDAADFSFQRRFVQLRQGRPA